MNFGYDLKSEWCQPISDGAARWCGALIRTATPHAAAVCSERSRVWTGTVADDRSCDIRTRSVNYAQETAVNTKMATESREQFTYHTGTTPCHDC